MQGGSSVGGCGVNIGFSLQQAPDLRDVALLGSEDQRRVSVGGCGCHHRASNH
jgi:hypothetical protein